MKQKTPLLSKKPQRQPELPWHRDENGCVTLEMANRGFWNRLAQRLLHKPRVSYIHLDSTGSFLWPLLDGTRDLQELGRLLEARFGEAVRPLYPRLAQYLRTLEACRLIR